MANYIIRISKGNETVLKNATEQTARNIGRKFTKEEYLNWLLNKWFENRRGEKVYHVESRSSHVEKHLDEGSSRRRQNRSVRT